MNQWQKIFYNTIVFLLISIYPVFGQQALIAKAPATERLQVLWRYCSLNFISDKEPTITNAFFDDIQHLADSLNDQRLKAYAVYFKTCSRILFSFDYEQHFPPGDYQSVINLFTKAKATALLGKYMDIAASADHYIGQVYFRANLFGQAFEHLLTADAMMRKQGYENVPVVSVYLYDLGLDYYRFEDYDKALPCFLQAIRHPVYLPRTELNTLNAVGLIYAKQKAYDKAADFYRQTIAKANGYNDAAWTGIASGNMGSIFLATGNNDSALYYYRLSYGLNADRIAAMNDAALCAAYMAKAFVRTGQPDSAFAYLHTGYQLARQSINNKAEWYHFYQNYLQAGIETARKTGDWAKALQLTDSLLLINDSVKQLLDLKILNRAVQKIEAERNVAELQLLESRKNISQLRLLLVIGALVAIIVVMLVVFKNYRLRKTEQERIAEKERQLLHLEKIRAEENLKNAAQQLETYLQTILEKNEYIQLRDAELIKLKENNEIAPQQSAVLESLLSRSILTDDDWRHFRGLFENAYPGFTKRLAERFPNLSPAETRLMILSKLNLSSREMANMLGVSIDAIRKLKYRLRKKIGLEEDAALDTLVKDI